MGEIEQFLYDGLASGLLILAKPFKGVSSPKCWYLFLLFHDYTMYSGKVLDSVRKLGVEFSITKSVLRVPVTKKVVFTMMSVWMYGWMYGCMYVCMCAA